MLTVCTWLWGDKYGPEYVRRLAGGVRRHLKEPHRFVVISDRDLDIAGVENFSIPRQDRHLLADRGCFARLRMFDPVWQRLTGITDRAVNIDLDAIITGPLDVLFYRPEQFLILQGVNTVNPCPFNGSLWMLRVGYRPDVWSDFSLEAAAKIRFHEFTDDQAWLAHKLPRAAGWKAGPQSGIYGFKKRAWPAGDDLPKEARLVVFPGRRDPSQFTHVSWIKENWAA